jgi:aminoglycoside 6'-N-acetyltransferase
MTSAYRFRPVSAADLPMLDRWRASAHWVEWWGPAEETDGFFEEAMADPHTAAWIVEARGRAFAYAQDYDPHAWPGHPFAHLPAGARGIDQSIGPADMLGRGHGSAFVRQHCARLFAAGVPAIGTDPHPANSRAIRAYEKAGFAVAGGEVETEWGLALLMERHCPAL